MVVFINSIQRSRGGNKYSSYQLLDEVEPLTLSHGQLYGTLYYQMQTMGIPSSIGGRNWVLHLESEELQVFYDDPYYTNFNGMARVVGDSIIENVLNNKQVVTKDYSELSIIEIDTSGTVWLTGIDITTEEKQLLEVNFDSLKVHSIARLELFFPEDTINRTVFSEKTRVAVQYNNTQTPCYDELGGGTVHVLKMRNNEPLLLSRKQQLFTLDSCGLNIEVKGSWFLNNEGEIIRNNNEGASVLNNIVGSDNNSVSRILSL